MIKHFCKLGILLGIFFSCASCADDTTSASFNLKYASPTVQAAITSDVTVRLLFTYGGDDQKLVKVSPDSAVPPNVVGSDGKPIENEYDWRFGVGAGSPITDLTFKINDIALGNVQSEVGVEFLKPQGNGQTYVFAAACIRPSNSSEPLTETLLKSLQAFQWEVDFGRTCGKCTTKRQTTTDPLNTSCN